MINIIVKSVLLVFLCLLALSFMSITGIQPSIPLSEVDVNPMLMFNNVNDTIFYVSYIIIRLALVLLVWYALSQIKLFK